MKKLFILLFSLSFSAISAQEFEWQKTIGGSGDDQPWSIKQTTDGGYIIGGRSRSNISGDKTENNMDTTSNYYDYWLVKTDSLGNVQWQNTIGGTSSDQLYSIQQTLDGGYILGGYSNSYLSGDKTESCFGSWDYWIVKTDATGNIQWQNTIGGNFNDWLWSIQQAADGGYILGGTSMSDISGDKTENCIGPTTRSDYWIVKTDSLGVIQWQNTIGGNDEDELHSIQQTSDGGYILGGYSMSGISGDKTKNNIGGHDYWIVKTDATGQIQWQNTIGGNDHDYLFSIQQTADAGYILGGYSKSVASGDKTENNCGGLDYWIVKTDSIGNIQWQNSIGGSANDELWCIQQTSDRGYILGGNSLSDISGDKTENSYGSYDYWVIKTDSLGSIQWQNSIGGNSYDLLRSIDECADGGFILAGYSYSNNSGEKSENSKGDYDYWMIKLNGKFNNIRGRLFIDINGNTILEAAEPDLINKKITLVGTGRFVFSEQNGNYSIAALDSGNFIVACSSPLNYYNSVPAIHTAHFSGVDQTDSLNDFAFQPAGVFNDLKINITPLSSFRSGFNASYRIDYENVGTTTLTPNVIFYPDADLVFQSATVSPASTSTDSITWGIGALAPFQAGSIIVNVLVNTGLPIGTVISSPVRIRPVTGDASPMNNYYAWEIFTIGSFDPNDILVNEDTLVNTLFPNPPFLDYIIRFQNTGNDTAFTVRILNPIDTSKLDIYSIEFVNASHPVTIGWLPWERNMEFKFANIFLPDSNINEPMSHGFVHYRIKPKSNLVAGDNITNKAYIYFDFNSPVVTNSAKTEIILNPTGVKDLTGNQVNLIFYPNPAGNEITIDLMQTNFTVPLKIYDVFGRMIFEKKNFNSRIKIDCSSWSSGVYRVRAGDQNGTFVKQ